MTPSHKSKPKICRVVTVPTAAIQLQDQLNQLAEMGFDITLISSEHDQYDSSGGTSLSQISLDSRIKKIPLTITRNISISQDLKSLFQLFAVFRKNQYDIVHSMTPKAGLLTAVAGFLARVPIRIHTFTGQRWAKLRGMSRFFFIFIDKIIVFFSTNILADSHSQAKYLIQNGVVSKDDINVVLKGSIAGVDLARFNYKRLSSKKNEFRQQFNFSEKSKIIVFIGRLTADKGIPELIESFTTLSKNYPEAVLLLVGPKEPDLEKDFPETLTIIEKHPHIYTFGFRDDVEVFIAMSDFMVLPSHREGFGGVVIQAAALERPTIGSKIYALEDSIIDKETGILFPVQDTSALQSAIELFLSDLKFTQKLGLAARVRAEQFFDSKVVNLEYAKLYEELFLMNSK